MGKRIKNLFIGLTTLGYVIMIGGIICNPQNFIFKEDWTLLLNLFLLCIGFYYFIETNNKK